MTESIVESKWHRFWYREVSRESLCLLRIFTGIALFMKLSGIWGLYRINDMRASFPTFSFPTKEQYMLEGFRLPIPGFAWLPVPSFSSYWIVFELGMYVLAILFTIGLFTRFVAPLLALLLLYWTLLSQFFYYHHMLTFLVVLIVLGFSNCWQHFSLDSYLAGPQMDRSPKIILPIRQLQIFVSILYAFSLLAKLNTGWYDGRVLESMRAMGSLKGIFTPIVFDYISFTTMSHFTIFSEAFLIFGLWFDRTRAWAILIGVLFHLGIDATMGVATFSYQILALYLVFLTPAARATKVFVAADSIRANRLSRVCNLLDWFRRLHWSYVDSETITLPVSINVQDFRRLGIAVVDPRGKVTYGSRAVWEVLFRLPVTFPLAQATRLLWRLRFKRTLSYRIEASA